MIAAIDNLFSSGNSVLALSASERLSAVRQFGDNSSAYGAFSLACIVLLVGLLVLLFIVNYYQKKYSGKQAKGSFVDVARSKGLSLRQTQLLRMMADKTKLKNTQSMFSISKVFDRCMYRMLEDCFVHKQADEARRLKIELSFLREKLGFDRVHRSVNSMLDPHKLTSRQIPTEKVMQIIHRSDRGLKEYECTVIRNMESELVVSVSGDFRSSFGDLWCVRCSFGALVCEFDSTTIKSQDDILVLDHNDNVRFINRRRFLRVAVTKPAYVSLFPFTKTVEAGGYDDEVFADQSGEKWSPPTFTPATVTEIGGPGLRISLGLKTKVGQRMLVTFQLDEGKTSDGANSIEVVEDMAVVRDVKEIDGGYSIAVELTNLSDSNIARLIRATNKASVRSRVSSQDPVSMAGEFLSNGANKSSARTFVGQGV